MASFGLIADRNNINVDIFDYDKKVILWCSINSQMKDT